MSLLTAIVLLGAIGIIRTRVRHNGLIAGVIFSVLPIFFFVIAMFFLLFFGVLVNQAAYNFSDEGEKAQEAWRQEQIASTGADPCESLYAEERERERTEELAESGAITDGDIMVKIMTDSPYSGMSWEEREAALAHAHEMRDKCPPLDYVESLQQEASAEGSL